MTNTSDEDHEIVQAFAKEFKFLVRKYMPKYPTDDANTYLLARLQEQTSCYSPWIWSDEEPEGVTT